MQTGKTIANLPLLIGGILSVAIHGLALYSNGLYTPPVPQMETGRTVVHLTLAPSVATQAAPPEPEPEKPPEPKEPEPVIPDPTPVPVPVPVSEPIPEPAAPLEPVEKTIPEPVPVEEPALQESVEQIASMQEDKGVITQAQPMSGISATYPRTSQRRGEEGTVVLSIEVLSTGKAGKVEVVESSGFRRLDDAAVHAAKKATYAPAKQFGRHIDSKLIQPLIFDLTEK
ncbi:hypothetical protein PDESU_03482 [Pontiella desulfatans]|uniref:TonB C-terminal domain-containing protein n=1 Tax=Pontiella desulfatans TaxID=2750659 RepID=A0A6C2U4D5_PONDE|nr:energy transducer TonB [Pontiella desulfatans]VGO14912.1 hypothetical protein PDESU_03482 [Pontiella desulfatans]